MTRLKIPLNLMLSKLQTRLKSSYYPLLNPITSPGTNPMPAAKGNPEGGVAFLTAILLFSMTASSASAHMRQLLTIGGKQYLLEVGSRE
jgi:hypothetical protein